MNAFPPPPSHYDPDSLDLCLLELQKHDVCGEQEMLLQLVIITALETSTDLIDRTFKHDKNTLNIFLKVFYEKNNKHTDVKTIKILF